MPNFCCRPHGKIFTTEMAVNHWDEAPNLAKPAPGVCPHHQTLYQSPSGFFFLIHSYTPAGGDEIVAGVFRPIQHKPAWGEVITRGMAGTWLWANGHQGVDLTGRHFV